LLDPATTVGDPAGIEFAVPKEQFGTIVVDDDNDLLKAPRTFKLADPSKPSSTLEKLPVKGTYYDTIPTTGQIPDPPPGPVPGGLHPFPPNVGAPVLQQNQLKVTMAYPLGIPLPDKSTPVWAMIKRNADSFQIVTGSIDAHADTVTIPLQSPITIGDPFDLLILAGRSPAYAKNVAAVA
jgi:hypothetical protein